MSTERIWGSTTMQEKADKAATDCLQRHRAIAALAGRLKSRGLKKKDRRLAKRRLRFEQDQLARSAELTRQLRAYQHPAEIF